jgi:hypothetical protein
MQLKLFILAYLIYSFKTCRVKINFITPEGEKITIDSNVGDSIMDITQAHDIDLECLFIQN